MNQVPRLYTVCYTLYVNYLLWWQESTQGRELWWRVRWGPWPPSPRRRWPVLDARFLSPWRLTLSAHTASRSKYFVACCGFISGRNRNLLAWLARIMHCSGSCGPQRYGSVTICNGSFYHQAPKLRKNLISTVLWLLNDLLKTDVNVPTISI